MRLLLKFSKLVDWLSSFVGKYVIWLILASAKVDHEAGWIASN